MYFRHCMLLESGDALLIAQEIWFVYVADIEW